MDVIEAINSRRSIRKYLDKPVSDELLNSVIDAARLAPSGMNAQPSRFFIAKDSPVKQKLKDNDIIRDKWAYTAPAIIVCCTDPTAYPKSVQGWDDSNQLRSVRDLSIASAYLVLRAEELGLGTCYCGWIKKEEIKTVLGIPSHYIVPYVITLGYAAESPSARPRKSIKETVL